MTDATTQRPLRVSTDGTAGPYIMVQFNQLAAVTAILEQNRIDFWVGEHAISLNGQPEIVVINLGRGADPLVAQSALDSVD